MIWNSTFYDNSHDFVAKYGEGTLSYLKARHTENILDLGCGTGDLTQKITLSGSTVVGVDSSIEMLERARTKFPNIEFIQMDATELEFKNEFDAIFSNAVLHWVSEKEKAIEGMYAALKKNGRIVLEFGGKGNNEQMLGELRKSFTKRRFNDNAKINYWYYPSIGEYSSALEKKNFRVVHAEHFDRFTPLKGKQGIKDWFLMFFSDKFFKGIQEIEKEAILDEVQENLTETHFVNGVWHADYKRIRIVAIKDEKINDTFNSIDLYKRKERRNIS